MPIGLPTTTRNLNKRCPSTHRPRPYLHPLELVVDHHLVPLIGNIARQAAAISVLRYPLVPPAGHELVLVRVRGAVGFLELLPSAMAADVLGDGMPRSREADEVIRGCVPALDGDLVFPPVAKVIAVENIAPGRHGQLLVLARLITGLGRQETILMYDSLSNICHRQIREPFLMTVPGSSQNVSHSFSGSVMRSR